MTQPNPSTALGRVVMDELANLGVRLVVISPGSRSTALSLAAVEHPRLVTVVALDERSAGFHALGYAKASSSPTAVVSTSGTAAANFLPAMTEADASCTPLIALTADRPVELRGVGANQTIDQVRLFGSRARYFGDIAAAVADEDRADHWRFEVSAAIIAALGGPEASPGPAHLNISFREPTVPVADDGRTISPGYPYPIERHKGPAPLNLTQSQELPALPDFFRGLVIAGDGRYSRTRLLDEADRLGLPVLATALSGIRGAGVIDSYHHILSDSIPKDLLPDLVIAIGSIGPSDRLETLVASASTRVRTDQWGRTIDPGRNVTHRFFGDAAELLGSIGTRSDSAWTEMWHDADSRVRAALDGVLDESPPSGAGVARALSDVGWGALVVASSLPIREVDAHLRRGGTLVANRGASGIDGFVSTSLGVARAIPRSVALAGDLSLLHDANGFLIDDMPEFVMVVVDNAGGGLFDSLPQAMHAPDFERLFIADQNRDLGLLAKFHGLAYEECERPQELSKLVERLLVSGGSHLVRARIDRGVDLGVRRRLDEAARRVVRSL